MRALFPLTDEERAFAEEQHRLVDDFLRYKRLSADDYYDVIVFGYLTAVQQYFRKPPANVRFSDMAFRAMKDAVSEDIKFNARPIRHGETLSLDHPVNGSESDLRDCLPDPAQDVSKQAEDRALIAQIKGMTEDSQMDVVALIAKGYLLHEAAHLLGISTSTARGRLYRLRETVQAAW